jgi:hypothetical protein
MREEKEVWVKRTRTILTCDQCGTVVESATTCSICERLICKKCWGKSDDRKIDRSDVIYEHACDFCKNVTNADDMINAMKRLKVAEDKANEDRYEVKESWKKLSRGGKK